MQNLNNFDLPEVSANIRKLATSAESFNGWEELEQNIHEALEIASRMEKQRKQFFRNEVSFGDLLILVLLMALFSMWMTKKMVDDIYGSYVMKDCAERGNQIMSKRETSPLKRRQRRWRHNRQVECKAPLNFQNGGKERTPLFLQKFEIDSVLTCILRGLYFITFNIPFLGLIK